MNVRDINGYPELVLITNCNMTLFFMTAQWLQSKLSIRFYNKVRNEQIVIWNFEFAGALLSLKHDENSTLSIQPHNCTSGTSSDKAAIKKLGETMLYA